MGKDFDSRSKQNPNDEVENDKDVAWESGG